MKFQPITKIEAPTIDWARVINNLRSAARMPVSRIALMVGSTGPYLTRIGRGEIKEPGFSLGMKLLDLHHDLMGERHREVYRG